MCLKQLTPIVKLNGTFKKCLSDSRPAKSIHTTQIKFLSQIAAEDVDKKITLVKLNSGQIVLERGTNSQGSKRQPPLDRP